MSGAVVISFANQKGGVGKTTSAVNVAASLGDKGFKTLLVDLDPQGNATSGVGVGKKKLRFSSYEALAGVCGARDAIQATPFLNLSVMPANMNLAGAEVELADEDDRQNAVRRMIDPLRADFDFILIDCPPALGMLTVNALSASDGVVIPMQCEFFALEGLSQLMMTIKRVKQSSNPALTITGILVTMHNGRLNLSVQVLEELKRYYADKLFRTVITRSVRLSEAPSFGQPVLYYDKTAKSAQQYAEVADELVRRVR